jgi:hypothetical protein
LKVMILVWKLLFMPCLPKVGRLQSDLQLINI